METEKGEDHKLLGVIDNDPRYLEYEDLHNVTDYFRDELKFFFEQYKNTKSDKFARLTGFRPK